MATSQGQRLGLAQRLLVALLWLYRLTLGGLLGGQCRFHPSCSVYAEAAVRQHGATRGVYLAAARVARCHPWNPGGLDPVPSTFSCCVRKHL
ncbi:MAG: membrane protein insertion efficiency factor YidD [Myxococcota bacterium]